MNNGPYARTFSYSYALPNSLQTFFPSPYTLEVCAVVPETPTLLLQKPTKKRIATLAVSAKMEGVLEDYTVTFKKYLG